MAGEALIGALRVVLGMDTAEFSKGASKASRDLAALQKAMTTGGRTMALAAAASGAALLAATKAAAAYGASIGDAAERVGVNVERFQELAYAAKLAGVDQEAFGKALEQMNKRLGEVKTGNTQAVESLGKLGLSLRQIKALAPDQAFELIAQRISQVKNPMEQAALAAEFFGKAGVKLLPMMAGGAAGLKAMAAEARRFGLILSEDTIDRAKKADDEFDRMALAFKVAGVNIASALLPAVQALANVVTSKEFQQGVKDLAEGLNSIVTTIAENKENIRAFAFALAGALGGLLIGGPLGAVAGALAGLGYQTVTATKTIQDFNKEIAVAETELMRWHAIARGDLISDTVYQDAHEKIKEIETDLKRLREERDKLISEPTRITVNKPPPASDPAAANAARALAEELREIQFRTQITNNEFRNFAAGFPEAAAKLKLFGQAGTEARTSIEQLPKGLVALNAELMRLEIAQLKKEALSPYDEWAIKLERINMLMRENPKLAAQLEAAQRKAAQAAEEAWLSATSNALGQFGELAKAFAKNNKEMGMLAKAFGISQAIINAYIGATKALAIYGPTPFGYAMAAGSIAFGIAQVAKISAEKFATGGAFTIPGGQGGSDRKMVPIVGFPGERVTVERPDQIANGGLRGALPREITIRVDEISRATVEKLIPALNAALGDGHKLKVA